MCTSPNGFSGKFSDFHGKRQKATSHHMYLQLSKSNSEEVLHVQDHHSSPASLLACFPVGNDSSWQSKQLPALNGNAHLLSPYCKCETPWEPFRERIGSPLISTKLTFKPQPLIEHWVVSLCVCSTVPGLQGSAFTEMGRTREPCSNSHIATDEGRGWVRAASSPNVKCTQYHKLSRVHPLASGDHWSTHICWLALSYHFCKKWERILGTPGWKPFFSFAFTLSQYHTESQSLRQKEKLVILFCIY